MPKDLDPQKKDVVKEILFTDYKYLQESFWNNEKIGETRVNFFITMVTAVIAALVSLLTSYISKEPDPSAVPEFVFYVILFAFFMLLGVGIITLSRLIKRNKVTDGYKTDMDNIRLLLKKHFSTDNILDGYLPFHPKGKFKVLNRKFGGLRDLIIFINSMFLAIITIDIAFLINREIDSSSILILSIIAFLVTGIVHYLLINTKLAEIIKTFIFKLYHLFFTKKLTHAGGVVYADGRFLITTSKDGKNKVLPKGHIEKNEKSKDTAIREVKEETGVIAIPIFSLGINKFIYKDEKIICKYYLMLKIDDLEQSERRQHYWWTYDEAKQNLDVPELFELLERARSHISNLAINIP